MTTKIGIDLVEPSKIKEAVEGHGERFLNRIYTSEEQKRCESGGAMVYQNYAAYFAAKEAMMKVLGTGASHITPDGVPFRDIEVYYDPKGAPRIRLYGKAKEVADEKGIINIEVSTTTLESMCAAVVTGEEVDSENLPEN